LAISNHTPNPEWLKHFISCVDVVGQDADITGAEALKCLEVA
jgi:hypothetical protein